ncbi:MAG: tetratricopeptide repeat protein [Myxococcales bacterium]|nr:tetratricopeptide repeat protein [Myxococcales bacterium]
MSASSALARAGHLFALVLAPRVPSPEPLGDPDAIAVAQGLAVVVIPPVLAIWMARYYDVLEGKLAAAAWVLASAALVYGAQSAPTHSPLLGSYYTAAPFVWVALALTAATLAGQHLGTSFRNKKMGAGLITFAIGMFLFREAHTFISSPTDQWVEVLARDPANERAFAEIRPKLASDPVRFEQALVACLNARPDACLCRLERASSQLLVQDAAAALASLDASSCAAQDIRAARLRATASALALPPSEAEAAVEATLAIYPEDATVLGAKAIVLDRLGRSDEALELAQRAVQGGAGYEARLLLAALLIAKGQMNEASDLLVPLAQEFPSSADVAFDLALIADRGGRYNEAREGYLRALKLRPAFAASRYNLALLTLRYGFTEEARSHARRFAEAFPADPRGKELLALVSTRN